MPPSSSSSSTTRTSSSTATVIVILATTLAVTVFTSIITIIQFQRKIKKIKDERNILPNWLYEYYNMNHPIIHITLPTWLYEYYKHHVNDIFITDIDMMKITIEISRLNSIVYKTGGPFGCVIFQRHMKTNSIQLYSVGVNYDEFNSTLHGEMMAIQFAQYKLQSDSSKCRVITNNHDDDNNNNDPYEYIVVSSCEPCCMCLGGIFMSNHIMRIHTIITGATKHDAE